MILASYAWVAWVRLCAPAALPTALFTLVLLAGLPLQDTSPFPHAHRGMNSGLPQPAPVSAQVCTFFFAAYLPCLVPHL